MTSASAITLINQTLLRDSLRKKTTTIQITMKALFGGVVATALVLSSCGSSDDVEVVNLDTVLDKFVSTAEALPAAKESELNKDELLKKFTADYQKSLNAAPLMKKPVGVVAEEDGSFRGFNDANENSVKDAGEADIFLVEIDAAQSRIIASDLQNTEYRRSNPYRAAAAGFLGGYLVSRMINRQRSAGVNTGKFRNMKMSPKGYHSAAASKVKSARGGGSKSFRAGK